MRVQNGIQIYENGEQIPITKEIPANFRVFSPYGFKIVEVDGKRMWGVATKEDYVKTVAQLLGISEKDVELKGTCHALGVGVCTTNPCTLPGSGMGVCSPIYNGVNFVGCYCV